MAEHVDAPDRIGAAVDAAVRRPLPARRVVVAVGLAVVALAGALGWMGYRNHQNQQLQQELRSYVQVARQAAINLTTISYEQADADVQRIVDSTTGAFRDDFSARAKPFIEVVKQAQSQSQGTVTEAGLESSDDDGADVLLAVSVNTTVAGKAAGTTDGPTEPEPRRWRMRISLQRTADGPKVSNIVFIP